MKARRIALVTVLLIAACVFMLGAVLRSGDAAGSALPAFLAVIAIVSTIGLVSLVRTQRGRARGH